MPSYVRVQIQGDKNRNFKISEIQENNGIMR